MYKKSAISKSRPFRIELINQKSFEWQLAKDFSSLTITKLDLEMFSDLDKSVVSLAVFAWDKEQEKLFPIPIDPIVKLPININFKGVFEDFSGLPYFAIQIYSNDEKIIIKRSKDFVLSSETQDEAKQSLLRLIPRDLGVLIAEIEVDENTGPVIYVNRKYKTQDNKTITYAELKNIVLTDPKFGLGFWPSAIKDILNNAIDFHENEWAQSWLFSFNRMVPGYLHIGDNDLLESNEGIEIFKKETIQLMIKEWIINYELDKKLFESQELLKK